MNSSLIGKVEKARRYAQEKERVSFNSFEVHFHGENDDHSVVLQDGHLRCNCDFFVSWETCSHTMAMERILEGMLPHEALSSHSL